MPRKSESKAQLKREAEIFDRNLDPFLNTFEKSLAPDFKTFEKATENFPYPPGEKHREAGKKYREKRDEIIKRSEKRLKRP